MRLKRFAYLAVSGILLLAFSFSGFAAAQQYVATELGALGGSTSGAHDINASGQVAGHSKGVDGHSHAFLYDSQSGMIHLGLTASPIPYASTAQGINAAGHVAGSFTDDDMHTYAFLYTAATGMVDIGTLAGNNTSAIAINDSGQITGSYVDGSGRYCSFLYDSGTMTDIGALAGCDYNIANDINAAGHIVGYSMGSDIYGFLYTPENGMNAIGSLGGYTYAMAINDVDQVVGSSRVYDGIDEDHPFLYSAEGGMVDIGLLPDGHFGVANDINNLGQIVGYSDSADGMHAYLYSNETMFDLNDLVDLPDGVVLSSAEAINDRGQIVATGSVSGMSRAFLLTPVPEPGTFALLAAGFVGLLAYAWRKRK